MTGKIRRGSRTIVGQHRSRAAQPIQREAAQTRTCCPYLARTSRRTFRGVPRRASSPWRVRALALPCLRSAPILKYGFKQWAKILGCYARTGVDHFGSNYRLCPQTRRSRSASRQEGFPALENHRHGIRCGRHRSFLFPEFGSSLIPNLIGFRREYWINFAAVLRSFLTSIAAGPRNFRHGRENLFADETNIRTSLSPPPPTRPTACFPAPHDPRSNHRRHSATLTSEGKCSPNHCALSGSSYFPHSASIPPPGFPELSVSSGMKNMLSEFETCPPCSSVVCTVELSTLVPDDVI